MSKKYFIAFGGPTSNYHNAVERVCREARNMNCFDTITCLTDKNLKNDNYFYNKHGKFLEENKRGYGYWLWKPYIVKKQLELMNDNDILVYADAGCVMNINGRNRLLEYFDIVNGSNYGILSFYMTHLEKTWTKMDLIDNLEGYDFLNSNQLQAAVFIIRKCEHSVNLVNKWYETCCIYDLINDSPSKLNNDASFREHRHDQSAWSIIRNKYGTDMIYDETYDTNWSNCKNIPILVMRHTY